MRAALLAGKSVVTANKQVMAHQGPALLTLAERQGRQLRFEAAVGGAMPIVRVLGDGLTGDRVLAIDAILNGTTNAVLSRMEAIGCAMDEAIADACAQRIRRGRSVGRSRRRRRRGQAGDPLRAGVRLRVRPDADRHAHDGAAFTPDDLRRARAARRHHPPDRARRHTTGERSALDRLGRADLRAAAVAVRADDRPAERRGHHVRLRRRHHAQRARAPAAMRTAVAIIGDLVTIARDRAAIVPAPVLVEPREIKGLSEHTFAEAV